MTVLTNLKAITVTQAEQSGVNALFEDTTGTIQAAIVTTAELIQQLNGLVTRLTAVNGADANIAALNTIITALS